jgi:hypothetical protein
VGDEVGRGVGTTVGCGEEPEVGIGVGAGVGFSVGALVTHTGTAIRWKNIIHRSNHVSLLFIALITIVTSLFCNNIRAADVTRTQQNTALVKKAITTQGSRHTSVDQPSFASNIQMRRFIYLQHSPLRRRELNNKRRFSSKIFWWMVPPSTVTNDNNAIWKSFIVKRMSKRMDE